MLMCLLHSAVYVTTEVASYNRNSVFTFPTDNLFTTLSHLLGERRKQFKSLNCLCSSAVSVPCLRCPFILRFFSPSHRLDCTMLPPFAFCALFSLTCLELTILLLLPLWLPTSDENVPFIPILQMELEHRSLRISFSKPQGQICDSLLVHYI